MLSIASQRNLILFWTGGLLLSAIVWSGPIVSAQIASEIALDSSNSFELPGTTRQDWEEAKRRLDELNHQIASLQKQYSEREDAKCYSASIPSESIKDATDADKTAATSSARVGKDNLLDFPPDKWDVRLGGHIQLDYVNWLSASPSIPNTHDYANFRRLRLVADGQGYETYDFRLQLTLEPESDAPSGLTSTGLIKDAYFSIHEIPLLGRFRIGHFFVPFSLEQVTNDTNNIFLERSIPTQTVFAADRELGMALYNCSANQRLQWSTGFFLDSLSEGLKSRLDDNQGYRWAGRLTYLPYYDEASQGRYLFHTGIGILHTDDQDDIVRLRSRPQISEGPRLIDSGAINADKYTTGNLEGAIVWGRCTVQSEAFLSAIDRNDASQTIATGAYVHLSWFLTGENRFYERFGQHGSQFGRNKPFRNFSAKRGRFQPGAWEFKTRWSHLDLNNFARGQYNDLSVGFNWYWSDRVRMMFDWIHPFTSSSSVFGETQSDILGMRWDVNW